MTSWKPSLSVERTKSPIWGRPATAHTPATVHTPEVGPPAIVLQLDPETTKNETASKGPSNLYLKVPRQSLDSYHSPLDSIIDQFMTPGEQKPICTIRKSPRHTTYIYQPPLFPIKEYPCLEEFAVRGWVGTECKQKEGIVKEWGSVMGAKGHYNRK